MQENYKILVVDDDMRLRALLERYLTEQGFQVRSVANAEQMDRLLTREDDRHRVALAAQTAANREPVFARQHQVQHHQVERFTRQQTIHLFRVRDATNLEA